MEYKTGSIQGATLHWLDYYQVPALYGVVAFRGSYQPVFLYPRSYASVCLDFFLFLQQIVRGVNSLDTFSLSLPNFQVRKLVDEQVLNTIAPKSSLSSAFGIFSHPLMSGSISVPGAVIFVNNDLSQVIQARLVTQLFINEVIDGYTFDQRFASDPNYVITIRAQRRRLMVVRNFQELTNRTQADVVIFVKAALATIERNCFGPAGETRPVKNLYWGHLCIYDTDLSRTCSICNCFYRTCRCPCTSCGEPNPCRCGMGGPCDMTYATVLSQNNRAVPALFPFASGGFGQRQQQLRAEELNKNFRYECDPNTDCNIIDCTLVKKT